MRVQQVRSCEHVEHRTRLHAAGEIDDIEDAQPLVKPTLDSSLVGWSIEIRWRY